MSKLSVLLTTLLFAFTIQLQAGIVIGNADNAFVIRNNSLVFDVLENDVIEGDLLNFGIEIFPIHGEVVINTDKTVTYTPHENVCEESDYFYYFLEDEDGPKLVEVSIDILCEPITVLNGFYSQVEEEAESPDSFTILGVENFPDNTLYVFSDAGKEIYYTEGYTNDWKGKNKNASRIETDRLYYYVFNDGLGGTYCGYLQMN
jgi:hypothetical protein